MPAADPQVRKTAITLADGRALIYFGDVPDRPAAYPDRRPLAAAAAGSQARWDRLAGEWVMIAGHRQDRTFQPADDQCPLCPSSPGHLTEIPAPRYEVVVFENRFPVLRTPPGDGRPRPAPPVGREPGAAPPVATEGLLASRPAAGRCEVVCFSDRHDASFADLTPRQAGTVLAAWADRTAELGRLAGVEQVYCFENRGAEIGVTLPHPHGQIYAFPSITPRTSRMLRCAAGHRRETGRNLFDDLLAAEGAEPARIVAQSARWTAFVPFAARWPYEVHLYPRRRVPDLPALTQPERDDFCALYLDMLRRFDRLFGAPAPYIAAWHQAPLRAGREDFALHLELFTVRRAPGKLKYLAGSESGMGAFANDIPPEDAARRLRDLG